MPKKDRILNLPGFTLQKVTGKNPLFLHVKYRPQPRCVHCHGKHLRKKHSFQRVVRHHTIARRQTFLCFKAYKFYCLHCHRYFNQRFHGILKYQRATEVLKEEIFVQHTNGVDQKRLATQFALGKGTIERWYHRHYHLKNQHIIHRPCPRILGVDEHFFTRKQGYATTFCDLQRQRIFDIAPGRSQSDLHAYLSQLPNRQRVNVVCIDLSTTYRSIIKRYFPQAKIVADRFHVIRLINHQCMKAYQQLDPTIKHQRGLLALLRTNPDKLSPKRRLKRDNYFAKQPTIAAIYQFKQQLHQLLMYKCATAKKCRRLIPLLLQYMNQLKQSSFEPLKKLGKTLYYWRDEIVRMWRFTKNNGITEGFHRKMKLIQRRAYGFRNFENYRLRVRVLCS